MRPEDERWLPAFREAGRFLHWWNLSACRAKTTPQGVVPSERPVRDIAWTIHEDGRRPTLRELVQEARLAELSEVAGERAYGLHRWSVRAAEVFQALAGRPAPDFRIGGPPDAGVFATLMQEEVDKVWAATGVAGSVRGLTTLEDVVTCQREELLQLRDECKRLRDETREDLATLEAICARLRG